MTDAEPKSLSVLPLNHGSSCLLPTFADYIGACAPVCLEHQSHRSGVVMSVDGDNKADFQLTWEALIERHRRTCADLQEATEYGAYGLAVLVLRETVGKTVMERSAKGPGFDFWIGDEEDSQLPFKGLARFEVSGILNGDDSAVQARVTQKKKQVSVSDIHGSPAYIAVVEFGRPLTRVESK